MRHLPALLGCAFAVSVAGCRCNKPIDTSSFGEIAIVYDEGGTTITVPNGTYDFCNVGMGTVQQLTLTVQNRGPGPLDLDAVEKIDGDNLKLGDTLDEEPTVFVL